MVRQCMRVLMAKAPLTGGNMASSYEGFDGRGTFVRRQWCIKTALFYKGFDGIMTIKYNSASSSESFDR